MEITVAHSKQYDENNVIRHQVVMRVFHRLRETKSVFLISWFPHAFQLLTVQPQMHKKNKEITVRGPQRQALLVFYFTVLTFI